MTARGKSERPTPSTAEWEGRHVTEWDWFARTRRGCVRCRLWDELLPEHVEGRRREPACIRRSVVRVWALAEGRSVYVLEHPGRARNFVLTIVVDDLHAHSAVIAARGLEDERVTYFNGVAEALYRGPEGNVLGFGRASLDAG